MPGPVPGSHGDRLSQRHRDRRRPQTQPGQRPLTGPLTIPGRPPPRVKAPAPAVACGGLPPLPPDGSPSAPAARAHASRPHPRATNRADPPPSGQGLRDWGARSPVHRAGRDQRPWNPAELRRHHPPVDDPPPSSDRGADRADRRPAPPAGSRGAGRGGCCRDPPSLNATERMQRQGRQGQTRAHNWHPSVPHGSGRSRADRQAPGPAAGTEPEHRSWGTGPTSAGPHAPAVADSDDAGSPGTPSGRH